MMDALIVQNDQVIIQQGQIFINQANARRQQQIVIDHGPHREATIGALGFQGPSLAADSRTPASLQQIPELPRRSTQELHQRYRQNLHAHAEETISVDAVVTIIFFFLGYIDIPLIIASCIILAQNWDSESSDELKNMLLSYIVIISVKTLALCYRECRSGSDKDKTCWGFVAFCVFVAIIVIYYRNETDTPIAKMLYSIYLTYLSIIGVCVTICCWLPCLMCVCMACTPLLRLFTRVSGRNNGISQEQLNRMNTIRYIPNSNLSVPVSITLTSEAKSIDKPIASQKKPRETTCSICLIDYEENDELRILDCSHDFHKWCIDDWLQMKADCPLCRATVIPNARSI
jgi:hypothetical protein